MERHRSIGFAGAFAAALCVLTTAGGAWAESANSPKAGRPGSGGEGTDGGATLEPKVSEQADRLLREMSQYLASAKEFSFHAEILYDDLLASRQKVLLSSFNDLAVRRPDRFASHSQGDSGGKRLWYDGRQLTLLDVGHGTFATEKAPDKLDAALDHLIGQLGFTPPLSDLLYSDPRAVLRRNTLFGFHVGLTEVDGARCHHLAFVEKNIDWQIWIDDGKTRVPRRMLITYKTLPGAPQFMATLTDWDFTTRLADSVFTPDLPEQAVRIEFLKAAGSAAGKSGTAEKKPR